MKKDCNLASEGLCSQEKQDRTLPAAARGVESEARV